MLDVLLDLSTSIVAMVFPSLLIQLLVWKFLLDTVLNQRMEKTMWICFCLKKINENEIA